MNALSSNSSLVSNIVGKQTNDLMFIIFSSIIGSILLALSSKIQIPLTPVPVTLQTMVLLVMSMFLGWRGALGATILYLFQGAAGLPVFAHGSGIIYLFGPTGGYLFGFILLGISWMVHPDFFRKIAYGSMTLGFILHTYGIILRMIIMSRPPISTIYETVIFVGFVIVLFSVVIEYLRKDGLGIFIGSISVPINADKNLKIGQ